ncbi:hypothetical protein GGR52DRAFT_336614 [Hypoxylon sp. FL1284]|nr:hypothetical protein GGR52DRAFT_336614 [Hypoxylon sp. FL1284]
MHCFGFSTLLRYWFAISHQCAQSALCKVAGNIPYTLGEVGRLLLIKPPLVPLSALLSLPWQPTQKVPRCAILPLYSIPDKGLMGWIYLMQGLVRHRVDWAMRRRDNRWTREKKGITWVAPGSLQGSFP